jgi:transcriptional regulator with XRE-family HTH domain
MVTYGYNIVVTFVTKYYVMKERLIQLLDLEQLSPSKFADIIGVQRSSISHIISGRNKPSFDFLERTLKAFPGLNASWLMLGEGTMYEQMGRQVTGNLFDTPAEPVATAAEDIVADGEIPEDPGNSRTASPAGAEPANQNEIPVQDELKEKIIPPEEKNDFTAGVRKRIVQVMVIYEDDTFRTYTPAN